MGMYLGENPVSITSNSAYGWIGSDTTYEGKLYEWNGTLNDTTYSSWTPSTTAGTILAAESNVATFSIPNKTLETFYVLTRWDMNFAYSSGTTMTYAPIRYTFIGLNFYYGYPTVSNLSQWMSGEASNYSTASFASNNMLQYYNSSGTLTCASTSYGPAYSTSAAAWTTNSSVNIVNVTLNRPALSARCSTTYFSTDRAANVDVTNSTIKYRLDLFKSPGNSGYEQIRYKMMTNIWNNNWDV